MIEVCCISGEISIDYRVKALALCGMDGFDLHFCGDARAEPWRPTFPTTRPGISTGPSTPMRAGTGMRQFVRTCSGTGMCREISTLRLPSRCGHFSSGFCSSLREYLYKRRAGWRWRFLCQPCSVLYAVASARTEVDGSAGVDADGDQSISLLLQPAGDPGTDADDAFAGCAESGGTAARA